MTNTPDKYTELFNQYKYNTQIFIESGTNKGGSVSRALSIGFNKIISIEPDPVSYKYCVEKFKDEKKVQLINDYSENVFDKIMSSINERCLIFLDGHLNSWFKEGTLPLKKELEILSNCQIKNHIIIIDDYYHFLKYNLSQMLHNINSGYKLDLI